VKRPWNKIIEEFDITSIMDAFHTKGIYNKNIFVKILEPLLLASNLHIDSTLEDLYRHSNIELHVFSVNIIEYSLKNISYKSHPNMLLLDAIYMSCCLPYIFEPYEYLEMDSTDATKKIKQVCLDGGLLNSYPFDICIDEQNTFETKNTNILGITFDRIYNVNDSNNTQCTYDDKVHTIFDFGYFLNKQMIHRISYLEKELDQYRHSTQDTMDNKYRLPYELKIPCESIHIHEALNLFLNEESRQKYIDEGEKYAYVFYNSVTST